MSEIIAQHHLPRTPEPGGRIPTVAPMELLEQDTPHSQNSQPMCSSNPGGKDPAPVSPTPIPKPAREALALLSSSCNIHKRQSQ